MVSNELVNLFYSYLQVGKLTPGEQKDFLKGITVYLQHNRSDDMKGRTLEFLEEKLSKFVNIAFAIGLTYEEMAKIIGNFPNLLNTIDDFYTKYLVLGVVEDEGNTIRKSKLLGKTRDYMVGLQQVYARYKLICESGYNSFTWNSLVHASRNEFAKIFVENEYSKPYQLFGDALEVTNWLEKVSLDELDIESFKSLDVNKEIVLRYEKREKGLS